LASLNINTAKNLIGECHPIYVRRLIKEKDLKRKVLEMFELREAVSGQRYILNVDGKGSELLDNNIIHFRTFKQFNAQAPGYIL
jgi:hypothetical protein